MFVDEVKKLQNEEEHEKELNADRSNGQMLEFLSLKLGKCPDFGSSEFQTAGAKPDVIPKR